MCLDHCQQAIEHHLAALDLARRTSVRYAEADALLGLASACQHQGQHAGALQHAEQAGTLACEGGFRILEGRAHATLATVHLDLDHCDEAIGHVRQALAIFRETSHRLGHARGLVTLGHGLHHAGDTTTARSCWQEAYTLLSDIGAADAAQVHTLLDST